jgi:gamma-glutamyltranspeptidase/glutathione hydrolase
MTIDPEAGRPRAGSIMQGTEDAPSTGAFPAPDSARPTLVGDHYVASAGHPLVAQVAARIFEAGGNAVDAGVAAGVAANVVEVCMCNFGGVAPILVRSGETGRVTAIDGIGGWGREATLERFRERYGDDMPLGGAISIVPGAPGAWIAALREFGTWTFGDVVRPAIELAADGFIIDRRIAAQLEITSSGFGQWPSSVAVFTQDGRPWGAGDRLRQQALARLLEGLAAAERGATRGEALTSVHRAFYEGEVAQRIVSFVRDDGGWLDLGDLAEHAPEVVAATSSTFRGRTFHTTGPWSQGPALLQTLAVLDGLGIDHDHNSHLYIATIAEAVRAAFADRERHYGDPRQIEVPIEQLLSADHTRELVSKAARRLHTRAPVPASAQPSRPRLDTTYLCTADSRGNVFSATPSDTLDGGPLDPELGILISPRGLQSWLTPGHPSALGPRRRPRLTPSPCIFENAGGGRAAWGIGSPGGDMILQAMLQVILNLVVFGMTPQQAVEAPRFGLFDAPNSFFPHHQHESLLEVESRVAPGIRKTLSEAGYEVRPWHDYDFDAGSVSIVGYARSSSGEVILQAAADPRRVAYAIGR